MLRAEATDFVSSGYRSRSASLRVRLPGPAKHLWEQCRANWWCAHGSTAGLVAARGNPGPAVHSGLVSDISVCEQVHNMWRGRCLPDQACPAAAAAAAPCPQLMAQRCRRSDSSPAPPGRTQRRHLPSSSCRHPSPPPAMHSHSHSHRLQRLRRPQAYRTATSAAPPALVSALLSRGRFSVGILDTLRGSGRAQRASVVCYRMALVYSTMQTARKLKEKCTGA